MRTLTTFLAVSTISLLGALVACDMPFELTKYPTEAGTDGNDAGIRDAGSRDGGSRGGPTRPDDGGLAATSLVPCPSGLLCWTDAQPTKDRFDTLMPFAENNVWVATNSGFVANWDGTDFQRRQTLPGGPFSEVFLWGSDPTHLYAFAQPATPNAMTAVLHWNGQSWTAHPRSGTMRLAVIRKVPRVAFQPTAVALLTDASGHVELVDEQLTAARSLPAVTLSAGETIVDATVSVGPTLASAWVLTSNGRAHQWRSDGGPANTWTTISKLGQGVGGAIWSTSPESAGAAIETGSQATSPVVRRQIYSFTGGTWTLAQELRHQEFLHYNEVDPLPRHGDATFFDALGAPLLRGCGGVLFANVHSSQCMDAWDGTWRTETIDLPFAPNAFASASGTIYATGEYNALYINRPMGDGHWGSRNWQTVAGRAGLGAVLVSAASDTNVWVLHTQSGEPGATSETRGLFLRHFDGKLWTSFALVDAPSMEVPSFTRPNAFLQAVGRDEAWLSYVGGDGTTWKLAHFTAQGQTTVDVVAGARVLGLAAASPNNVYLTLLLGFGDNSVLHFDGREWDWLSTSVERAGAVATAGEHLWLEKLENGAFATSSFIHRDSGGEHALSCDVTFTTQPSLVAVGDEAWGWDEGALVHLRGKTCTVVPLPDVPHILEVSGALTSDVWLLGQDASNETKLLHWDGSQFTLVKPNETIPLSSASVSSSGTLWVGGFHGAVLASRIPKVP